MSMNLSENYHLRKRFLESDEVPTQSLIKKKMSPPLAAVYFKSMNKKLKLMVGLEPPMKGGGGDWYVPPKDILEGRTVLKPLKREYLSKLNYFGIDEIGRKLLDLRLKRMKNERNNIISEDDERWKRTISVECEQYYEDYSNLTAKRNTEIIQNALDTFATLYGTSLTSIETLMFDAACSEIKNIRKNAYQKMKERYTISIKTQAISLYDAYSSNLQNEKLRLKYEFYDALSKNRTAMGEKIHDINLEKHTTIEKLRKYLECQRLACQVYVALKEREAFKKEKDDMEHVHKKKAKMLSNEIALRDLEINTRMEKEKNRKEFNQIWRKKVWVVVQKFQIFVAYCLNLLPEHADFFINTERLMLLQLNDVLEDPSSESIFVYPKVHYEPPRAVPRPFYLFCDKGQKSKETRLNKDLCPKRCTSSASQMPAIVINKRCMYAACDNFQQFTNKVKFYIQGKRGDDIDFADDHYYEYDVPVKYTASEQLYELRLESSLLQVLHQELENIKALPLECKVCKVPYCFCNFTKPPASSIDNYNKTTMKKSDSDTSVSSGKKLKTRNAELVHERDPKWKNYIEYIEPKKCKCMKTAKKHLVKNYPAYMQNVSVYDTPDIPNYEICPLDTLKRMVKRARGSFTKPAPKVSDAKTRDVGSQCTDLVFDTLCTCMSEPQLQRVLEQHRTTGPKLFDPSRQDENFALVDCEVSPSLLLHHDASFVHDRAKSLKNLIDRAPELKEIFKTATRKSVFD